jgi:predicted RNA binding protein YcfA (HicA-like mRNA interferase family)
VKVREAVRMLSDDGWSVVVINGGHRQFKHGVKAGRVTVSGKLSDELHPKTAASILRQAGLRR